MTFENVLNVGKVLIKPTFKISVIHVHLKIYEKKETTSILFF